MKKINKYFAAVPLAVAVLGLTNCTKHDQVLDLSPATDAVTPVLNTSVLNSPTGTATLMPIGGGAWDGVIGAEWAAAPKLEVTGIVPDLGNGTFEGFIGNTTNMTLRSLHDANDIYFLIEWASPQKNLKSAQWYFNPTQTDKTKRWAQEVNTPVLNSNGTYRPPFIHDQFVIMFNVANSTPSFNAQSCYASCHVNTSFGGPAVTGGTMRTNGPNEILDVWRARMLQVASCNQGQDTYIDWADGILNKHGRHDDAQINSTDGGFANKQSKTITGTTLNANIPLWVYPSGAYSNSAIMLSDTLPGGAALKVIAVDSFGVLTLSDLTTIDPRTSASGTDYQQVGAGDGAKCIPGSILAAYTGSRGDVTANAFYTGTGWRLLFKRALTTTDATKDIDFSSLSDQPFGVGVMFNGANDQHATVAGLTLHFQ